MPWTCLVQTCDSNTKKQANSVSTFKVPDEETEKELYDKWLAAIPGCNVLKKNHRICEKHFRTGQIIREFVTRTESGEFISINSYKYPRLVKGSVPCIFAKPGQKLDSRVYIEHAYVTKSSNSCDELPNQSEEPCETQEIEINLNGSCPNDFETIASKQDCQVMSSSNLCDVDEVIDDEVTELPNDATTRKSASDKTVTNSNIISKLPNDQILSNSATTAIFQSATFDFDGKSNNPNTRVKLIIDLVKPWNASRAMFGDEEYLILSHIVEVAAFGKKSHTLEKAVLISKDRKITYEVYGRPCDVDLCKLPKVLENVTSLTEILKRFKDLPICEGVKIFNTNFLTAQTKTFDEHPTWCIDDCTLISFNGDRCSGCQKKAQILPLSNPRKNNFPKLPSISLQSNPVVQKKLNTTQNKMKYQATLKKRLLNPNDT